MAEGWRALARAARFGEVQAELERFASGLSLDDDTVRRYEANLTFVESLLAAFPHLAREDLLALPQADLQSMKRIARFGMANLEPHLPEVIARRLSGRALLRKEKQVRKEIHAAVPTEEVGVRALRLRTKLFSDIALGAHEKVVAKAGGVLVRVSSPPSLSPLQMDAIARFANAFGGVKLMPATTPAADPERIRAATLLGMAAGGVFSTFVFLVERKEDAQALAASAQDVRSPSCIGVTLIQKGACRPILVPDSKWKPDRLAKEWAKRLADETLPYGKRTVQPRLLPPWHGLKKR